MKLWDAFLRLFYRKQPNIHDLKLTLENINKNTETSLKQLKENGWT